MLPKLPPPPIVPEASRRGTGGARLAPVTVLPPPPLVGITASTRLTPPESPIFVDDSAEPAPVPQPRSLLYNSMPSFPEGAISSNDRSSGSGVRLALGAQRLIRMKPAPSSPLATSVPTQAPSHFSKPIDPSSLITQASMPVRPVAPISQLRESRVISPPATPPNLSPRSPASPPRSPPVTPRSQAWSVGPSDWARSRSPPGSPDRGASPPRGTASPPRGAMSPPRGTIISERGTGFHSPPLSPERNRSPPARSDHPKTDAMSIRPKAAFRGVFDDRGSTLSVSAPDRILRPAIFGMPLSKVGDKEREVPTFLTRLVTRIRQQDDIAREVYWIDSEFESSIDSLQVSLSKDYPDAMLSFDGVPMRTLAGLLKRYFMFLVEPLLPHEIYDRLSPLRAMHHITLRTQFMGSVLFSLNPTHRSVIMFMLLFLQDVLRAEYGIPIDRLSRAFGMVFFRAKMAFPSDEVKRAFQQGCALVIEMLITHADDLSHLDVSYSNDAAGLVVSASAQSLLYKLVDPVYRDPEFTDTFLCCREYLGLNDLRLVERLIDMFNLVSEERLEEMRRALRLRVLEVFLRWMKVYEGVVGDPSSVGLLQNWLLRLKTIGEDEAKLVEELTSLLTPAPKPSLLRFLSSSMPMLRIQSILQLEPDDIAIQLTLREFEYIKTLPISELLHKNFTREAKSPKWQASVQGYNRLASWVAQEIVIRKESVEARAKVITKFIAVCESLLRLNNYNSLFALLGGLNNPGVNRLALSWEKAPKKAVKAYKALMVLFDPGQNYKAYRDAIAAARPPFVPYLALLGKWLFAIEENNTSFLSDKSTIVNFDKMRNIYKVVSQVRLAREGEYRFIEHPDFTSLMANDVLLTDDEIYERSLQCEARK